MTGLPFWSVVSKTLSAFSTAGQTSLTSSYSRSVPDRGNPGEVDVGRELEEHVDQRPGR